MNLAPAPMWYLSRSRLKSQRKIKNHPQILEGRKSIFQIKDMSSFQK